MISLADWAKENNKIFEWNAFIYHCTKCHHEWEFAYELGNQLCNWCGGEGEIIE
jgi:rRNA maturation endonuclease Nob1